MLKDLLELVEKDPATRHLYVRVGDRIVTLGEVASAIERGEPWALEACSKLGLDPEVDWEVAERYFSSLPNNIVVYYRGVRLTPRDIVEHIRRRDEIGRFFVEMYINAVKEVVGIG